jgi:hypothetical protein
MEQDGSLLSGVTPRYTNQRNTEGRYNSTGGYEKAGIPKLSLVL